MAIPGILSHDWHAKAHTALQHLTLAQEVINHAEGAGIDLQEKRERCEALLALMQELVKNFPAE